MSRLVEDAVTADNLKSAGERDLETLIKHLAITVYTGESISH